MTLNHYKIVEHYQEGNNFPIYSEVEFICESIEYVTLLCLFLNIHYEDIHEKIKIN